MLLSSSYLLGNSALYVCQKSFAPGGEHEEEGPNLASRGDYLTRVGRLVSGRGPTRGRVGLHADEVQGVRTAR